MYDAFLYKNDLIINLIKMRFKIFFYSAETLRISSEIRHDIPERGTEKIEL